MKTKLTLALCLVAIVASAAYFVPNWKRPQRTLAWDYTLADQTNIVSFKLYYGVEPGKYTNYVVVPPSSRVWTITNLIASTTYYYAATAVDPFGWESEYSNEVTNTIPAKPVPPGQYHIIALPDQ